MTAFNPHCPQCGAVRPEGDTSTHCVPCANVGHYNRLILNPEDAAKRLKVWTEFWDQHGYTKAQRKKIPIFKRLSEAAAKS